MSTALYERIMAHDYHHAEMLALTHKVWDPTPWVMNVYTGSYHEEGGIVRRDAMSQFCRNNFGKESWPIHDKPANWIWGSATVDGWTWIGFATQAMMDQFTAEFPQGEIP